MREIANRIRDARISAGFTQGELAKRCGYKSRSSINKIEQDAYECSLEVLKKIAKALNVSPDYLIFGDEKEDIKEEIIRLYDLLTPDQKESFLQFLRSTVGDRARL